MGRFIQLSIRSQYSSDSVADPNGDGGSMGQSITNQALHGGFSSGPAATST